MAENNPVRNMISGRDFQVRYALDWILNSAVAGQFEHSGQKLLLEGQIRTPNGETIYPDIMVTTENGHISDIIECKEHDSFVPESSIIKFIRMIELARGSELVTPDTRFCFACTSLIMKSGRHVYNLRNPRERQKILGTLAKGFQADRYQVQWDFSHRDKLGATHSFLWRLMGGYGVSAGECLALYTQLYALLTLHMSERLKICSGQDAVQGRDRMMDMVMLDLHQGIDQGIKQSLLGKSASQEILLDEIFIRFGNLCKEKRHVFNMSKNKVLSILRRELFKESNVTLEDIYVPQKADLIIPRTEKEAPRPYFDQNATDLLFKWITQVNEGKISKSPLLVMGSFGSGKSSLLTWFALQLIEKQIGLLPVLVPLRDIRPRRNRSLSRTLEAYVKSQWDVDLSKPSREVKYCLLCDGFDELNLFFNEKPDTWVRDCFFELRDLAEKNGVCMIISSRPVLMMDVTARSFEGKDCPRLSLHLFSETQIEEWCSAYRRTTEMPEFFNLSFLEEKGLYPTVSTPIILYMTARLVETSPDAFKEDRSYSKAEIFNRFVSWTCSHGGYYKDDEKHRLPWDYRQMLREIAWKFFQTGNPILKETELLDHLKAKFGEQHQGIPTDRNILTAHMFQPAAEDKDTEEQQGQHTIEFTHQTFKEFLVAEKIRDTLDHVIQGNPLDAEKWNELGRYAFSNVEIDFLRDMVQELPEEQALNLFNGMDQACLVHTYWSTWLLPVIKGDRDDAALIQDLTSHVMRPCTLAPLAFMLQLFCFNRLKHADLPEKAKRTLSVSKLSTILRFAESITGHIEKNEVGKEPIPNASRTLLLQNLDGIVLSPEGGRLLNHNFEGIVLQKAVLKQIYFSGSEFHGADFTSANCTRSVFQRCLLWIVAAKGARFLECDFTDAIFVFERGSEMEGGDFSGSDFTRVQFRDPAISDAIFTGNTWEDARVTSSGKELPLYLENCRLDRDAAMFFRAWGVELKACDILS